MKLLALVSMACTQQNLIANSQALIRPGWPALRSIITLMPCRCMEPGTERGRVSHLSLGCPHSMPHLTTSANCRVMLECRASFRVRARVSLEAQSSRRSILSGQSSDYARIHNLATKESRLLKAEKGL